MLCIIRAKYKGCEKLTQQSSLKTIRTSLVTVIDKGPVQSPDESIILLHQVQTHWNLKHKRNY